MISRQKARNQFLFLIRKAKHECSFRAKILSLTFWWLFLSRVRYWDWFIHSKNPSHFGWAKLPKKMCIRTYSHIFMYGILLILLVYINNKRYAKIQHSQGNFMGCATTRSQRRGLKEISEMKYSAKSADMRIYVYINNRVHYKWHQTCGIFQPT